MVHYADVTASVAVVLSAIAAALSSLLGYRAPRAARRDLEAKRQLLVSVKVGGVEVIHDASVAAGKKDSPFNLFGVEAAAMESTKRPGHDPAVPA